MLFKMCQNPPFLTTDPEHKRTEGKKETFYTRNFITFSQEISIDEAFVPFKFKGKFTLKVRMACSSFSCDAENGYCKNFIMYGCYETGGRFAPLKSSSLCGQLLHKSTSLPSLESKGHPSSWKSKTHVELPS
ncbi:hypothetical protein pdam_00024240 [Pocillopora damicornis]|uniref:Uncharacterized protein n=1 Tax=Pocillopora damicornis TaxID=46731 RepID=A0A3M6UH43_POCDA|nr:hypothetical protein pdam_00024240 [Pocillopora damicornis]